MLSNIQKSVHGDLNDYIYASYLLEPILSLKGMPALYSTATPLS
jgi:hypothetical protein